MMNVTQELGFTPMKRAHAGNRSHLLCIGEEVTLSLFKESLDERAFHFPLLKAPLENNATLFDNPPSRL